MVSSLCRVGQANSTVKAVRVLGALSREKGSASFLQTVAGRQRDPWTQKQPPAFQATWPLVSYSASLRLFLSHFKGGGSDHLIIREKRLRECPAHSRMPAKGQPRASQGQWEPFLRQSFQWLCALEGGEVGAPAQNEGRFLRPRRRSRSRSPPWGSQDPALALLTKFRLTNKTEKG